ncbi:MAG: helix-turn-helix transcriptional regulator [Weeksellaceae bacterium]
MELTNRILEILEKSGLTSSEFADKIEVQRSAISHITSGRNKPSLDFLLKIKDAFPEIDTDWLLFGREKEEILEDQLETEISTDLHPTLFDFESSDKISRENQSKNSEEKLEVASTLKESKKIIRALLFYDDGSFEDFVKK